MIISHFILSKSKQKVSQVKTYNGDLAAKMIFDLPRLDRIGGVL